MSIPHDQYLRHIDHDALEETLEFHCKGNYVIHPLNQHMSALHHLSEDALSTLTGNELQLNILDSGVEDATRKMAPLHPQHSLCREPSSSFFKPRRLPFSLIKRLLAPLISKTEGSYHRGYASGGALYPVEVFCCNLQHTSSDWPDSAAMLHLVPKSQSFEKITHTLDNSHLRQTLSRTSAELGSPAIALIYFLYLPKSLFKYRFRGYRLSLFEAGEMAMLTDLRCKELKLRNRLWSGFTDHEITQSLNLNPALFLPVCIQFIG
ncbi:hypothetical protein ACLUUI_05065 [Enterobacterales bacterium AW_CKDN230030176-1A_HGKHYDSX7]